MTLAPRWANPEARACPIPRLPPETSTTLSRTENNSSVSDTTAPFCFETGSMTDARRFVTGHGPGTDAFSRRQSPASNGRDTLPNCGSPVKVGLSPWLARERFRKLVVNPVATRIGEKCTQSELANLAWRVYFLSASPFRSKLLTRARRRLRPLPVNPLPGGVMVARVTLDHLVEVRILAGQLIVDRFRRNRYHATCRVRIGWHNQAVTRQRVPAFLLG
jgi:hypothetical protein